MVQRNPPRPVQTAAAGGTLLLLVLFAVFMVMQADNEKAESATSDARMRASDVLPVH